MKKTKQTKNTLGQLFRKKLDIQNPDLARVEALKKAIKKLRKAEALIDQALPDALYKFEITDEITRMIVNLEQSLGYYEHGEVDPIR